MKKLLALALLGFATAAQATEINPDTGFDSPGSWMVMGDSAHASVTGSKAVFSGATKMTMVSQTTSLLKKGHKYRISWTVSSFTSGSVSAYAGMTMTGSVSVSPVTSPTTAGATSVADNFTTASGLQAGSIPAASVNPDGQFRMTCGAGPIRNDDPIVYPGMPGRSHAHQFYGNTNVTAATTFNSIRTTGGTTCGNANSPSTPINRSGYWFPAMDGGDGYYRSADSIKLYYKRDPVGSASCIPVGDTVDRCNIVPNGLRMIGGWKSSDNSNGVSATVASTYYDCSTESENSGADLVTGTDMQTVINNAACVNAYNTGQNPHLFVAFLFPNCWNGTQLDTADHRSHVAYDSIVSGTARCPSTHPYRIANISFFIYWTLDAQAFAGKWHLSSDTMFAGNAAGYTFHADYFEGWSPSVKATFHQYCIDGHLSCSGGLLGDGTQIKTAANPIPSSGTVNMGNSFIAHQFVRTNRLVATGTVGLTKPCKANGTCTAEVIAAGAGEFGLFTNDGNMQVDNLQISEISAGSKGPVTTH